MRKGKVIDNCRDLFHLILSFCEAFAECNCIQISHQYQLGGYDYYRIIARILIHNCVPYVEFGFAKYLILN